MKTLLVEFIRLIELMLPELICMMATTVGFVLGIISKKLT